MRQCIFIDNHFRIFELVIKTIFSVNGRFNKVSLCGVGINPLSGALYM